MIAPVSWLLPLMLALAQGSRPQLEASVDEDRVSVGEELTYTLRAVSRSPAPMQVTIAPFTGLEIRPTSLEEAFLTLTGRSA